VQACPSCGAESRPDARFCWSCGAPLAGEAPSESRRVVTVVFCDLADSTRLGGARDPEPVRRVLERYFAAMRGVIEGHGGTVEKFIGDAVMAVFGVPELHEDDPLRAVRAALDMQERVRTLNADLERDHGVTIDARIGVATGEVVAGDPARRQTIVTGEAVNLAARLEQAAPPGGVLASAATYALVRDAVRAEAVGPLDLKGRGPTDAWRVLEARHARPATGRLDAPLVDRDSERRALEAELHRTLVERRCRLVSVVGEAGIGKSRLAEEALEALPAGGVVVRCRCLPYGEGITFWPVLELVRAAAAILPTDAPATAEAKVRALVPGPAGERVAGLAGLIDAPGAADDAAWAFRALLEALAADGPAAVVVDDLHWAEPTLLDVLAYAESQSRGRPILLVCLARPDLLERRPDWATRPLVRLEPLADRDAEALADARGAGDLPGPLRRRILAAAGGNPLFVEQMVALLAETGEAESPVPPSIQSLLAVRLDRLPAGERRLLERAAVIGRLFARGGLAAVADERDAAELDDLLGRLAGRGLVAPEEAPMLGGPGFRFTHTLLAEAAYARLTKELRAELHTRFADWLETAAGERVRELNEVLGYHLERAVRYREELGPLDGRARELGRRAAAHLGAGGDRALGRGDAAAAVRLLERAAALLPLGHEDRPELVRRLGAALIDAGDLERATGAFQEALGAARSRTDVRTEWRAAVDAALLGLSVDPREVEGARRLAETAIEAVGRLGDDVGAARAWRLLALVETFAAETATVRRALEQALVHARAAGDRREEAEIEGQLLTALTYGAAPVDEGIRAAEEHLRHARERGSPSAEARVLPALAALRAMRGEFEEARALVAAAAALVEDLGWTVALVNIAWVAGEVELMAGDAAAARSPLREAYERLQGMGERSYLSTVAAMLALAEFELGNEEEALRLAGESAAVAAPGDAFSQVLWRSARALVLSRRGDSAAAEALGREALERAAATDSPVLRADAFLTLATVLDAAGRRDEAAAAAGQALVLAEAKGLAPTAARARSLG
jgi:class 3 adenylate cyclase/predicted ATPase